MNAVPGAGGCEVLAGRYEVGGLVGLGGTARVYRARDQVGDATVAVKIFPAGSAGGEGSRELAALDGMRHPGLVAVRDSGVDADGRPFVVMDYIEGQSLAARLRDGALSAATVTAMGTTLADALAHVHASGVVHRDVKPGNVLLDGDGQARLTDFGIARLIDATRVTATGLVVGTAAYMAPEQVRGEVVGPPADIYALGLVLLEAVTGRREFEGGALEAAIARLHRSPVVPGGVPEPLASQIARMTATDPAARPAAPDVVAALARRPVPRRPLDGLLDRRLVSAGAVASLAASVVAATVLLTGADTSAARSAEPALVIAAPEPVAEPDPVAAPPVTTTTPPLAAADEPPAAAPTAQRRASVPVALAGRTTVTRTITRPAPPTRQEDDRTADGRTNRGGGSGNGKKDDGKRDDGTGGRPADGRDDDSDTPGDTPGDTPNDDPTAGDHGGDGSGPGNGNGNGGGSGNSDDDDDNDDDTGDDGGSGNRGGDDTGDDSGGDDDGDGDGDGDGGRGNSGRGNSDDD